MLGPINKFDKVPVFDGLTCENVMDVFARTKKIKIKDNWELIRMNVGQLEIWDSCLRRKILNQAAQQDVDVPQSNDIVSPNRKIIFIRTGGNNFPNLLCWKV